MSPEPLPPHDARAMHHLVGGGIASLATAILLIRDPGVPGRLAAVGSDQHKVLFSQKNQAENTID
jgi:myosin-crossreactive antigen